ncbi:MAG TPA: glycosyltransferase [Chitinophagaceae bacterium]|nr:glycosyltransferase [Chitinophagaceae bacterium]
MSHTIILFPFFNDEVSLNLVLNDLEKLLLNQNEGFSVLIVNDGTPSFSLKTKFPYRIIHLQRNIGHQKAIAIGLAYAHEQLSFDQVLVMDCDGEDRPEDAFQLLQKENAGSEIVVARRSTRQESKRFRFFYRIYKLMFLVLTGKKITFGNFMLLPRRVVDTLVYHTEIWNHLAGAVLKSKITYSVIDSHRGKRRDGVSKMSFTSLLLHGLGAIGVFIEIVASRLLLFSLFLIALSVVAILVIFSIRFFTNEAIPGWATTAVSSMLIILLQSFLLSLFIIFLYLSLKTQRQFIPANHYKDYVRSVEISKNE